MSASAEMMARPLRAARSWKMAGFARGILGDLVAAVLGASLVLGAVGSCGDGCNEAHAAELERIGRGSGDAPAQ